MRLVGVGTGFCGPDSGGGGGGAIKCCCFGLVCSCSGDGCCASSCFGATRPDGSCSSGYLCTSCRVWELRSSPYSKLAKGGWRCTVDAVHGSVVVYRHFVGGRCASSFVGAARADGTRSFGRGRNAPPDAGTKASRDDCSPQNQDTRDKEAPAGYCRKIEFAY